MKHSEKTREELIKEVEELTQRVSELEVAQAEPLDAKKTIRDQDEDLVGSHGHAQRQSLQIEQEVFGNIIDAPTIQSLMDEFYKLTNIGIAILDLKGNVLVATGWQDVCTRFHRVHPETLKNCMESDLFITSGLKEGEYRSYNCKNNMRDMVTPIMMGERLVGNIYLGQFFFDDELPDFDVFNAQAQKYGFDKDEYLDAVHRVPRWSRHKVNTVMTFYSKLSSFIGSLSYSNVHLAEALADQKRATEDLRQSEQALKQKIDELERFNITMVDREFRMIELKKEINELLEKSGNQGKYRIVE
jgi:ligand-binding sensor protein